MVDHGSGWSRPGCQAGPLAPVMEELVGWLDAQGYAATTQRNLVRAAGRLDAWMLAENVRLVDVDRSGLARLVREDNERHPEHVSANGNVSAVLRFLEERGLVKAAEAVPAVPRPAQRCVLEWLRFLEVDQGQGASWVAKAGKVGESFLRLIEGPRGELAWERFIPFLDFGPATRKVIYTTNSIESLNYQMWAYPDFVDTWISGMTGFRGSEVSDDKPEQEWKAASVHC